MFHDTSVVSVVSIADNCKKYQKTHELQYSQECCRIVLSNSLSEGRYYRVICTIIFEQVGMLSMLQCIGNLVWFLNTQSFQCTVSSILCCNNTYLCNLRTSNNSMVISSNRKTTSVSVYSNNWYSQLYLAIRSV